MHDDERPEPTELPITTSPGQTLILVWWMWCSGLTGTCNVDLGRSGLDSVGEDAERKAKDITKVATRVTSSSD
jgi:hypothetical protein